MQDFLLEWVVYCKATINQTGVRPDMREMLTQIEYTAYELAQVNLTDPTKILHAVALQGLILGMVKARADGIMQAQEDYFERTHTHELPPEGEIH